MTIREYEIEPLVEVSEVEPGDVVRIDFTTWGIWGTVFSKGPWHDTLSLRRHEDDGETEDHVLCTGATVRMIRRGGEPDPDLVQSVRSALIDFAGEEMVITSGDLPYRLALRFTKEMNEKWATTSGPSPKSTP